jgi:hypothetical protein
MPDPEPRHYAGLPDRSGRDVPAAGRRDTADGRGRAAYPRSGIVTLGITVGLFDEYGPAQRLYRRRGYIPDGRDACRGQEPLRKGMQVAIDDDLIIWLTKDLPSCRLKAAPHRGRIVPLALCAATERVEYLVTWPRCVYIRMVGPGTGPGWSTLAPDPWIRTGARLGILGILLRHCRDSEGLGGQSVAQE